MSKMVGILGGMGAFAGLRLCQHALRTAAKHGAVNDEDFPKLLYYNLPLKGMNKTGVVDGKLVLGQLRGAIGRMESFGCDVIVIGCNSLYCFHTALQGFYSGALLNVIETACYRVNRTGPVGVICSETTKAAGLYESALTRKHLKCIATTDADQQRVTGIIEAVMGGTNDRTHSVELHSIICNLKARGAETIILGCTELGEANGISVADVNIIDSGLVAVEDALNYRG